MARSGSESRFSRGVNSCSAAVRTPTFMNFGSKALIDILLVSLENQFVVPPLGGSVWRHGMDLHPAVPPKGGTTNRAFHRFRASQRDMLNSSEDVPYFGLINVRYYVARWSRGRRIDRHRAAYCLRRLGVSRFGLTNPCVLFFAFNVVLMTWGTAPLFFWVGRKIAKRGVKGAKPNAN